jgi:uncharacterized protein
MTAEDDPCAAAKKFRRIDDAFQKGDLEALRAAVDDPAIVPNGAMPPTIGSCLVYAIYHSPLQFIRTLLKIGANPNAPVADGFPPLIAALSCGREVPGARRRTDVEEIIRLLLSFGADPNQRGINDFTPLHMAVGVRNSRAIEILLDHGADPELRTRIDDLETPMEMARAAGLEDIAAIFAPQVQHNRRLRPGLMLLTETGGRGEPVRRGSRYRIRLRLWLHDGQAVRWQTAWGPVGAARLEDNGETLITEVQFHRRSLVNGLFYGIEGMRVGGKRRLEIAPHLAYGNRGVSGMIPGNAVLLAEITILDALR